MESARVYIGNLNHEANRQDVEDFFKGYGPIRDIWIARRPPGFAFVEFEHPKDAADACAALSGQDIRGQRVRVEVSTRGFRGPRNPRPDAGDRDRGYAPIRGRSRSRSRERYVPVDRNRPRDDDRGMYSPPRRDQSRSPDRRRSRSPDRRRSRSPRGRRPRSPSPRGMPARGASPTNGDYRRRDRSEERDTRRRSRSRS